LVILVCFPQSRTNPALFLNGGQRKRLVLGQGKRQDGQKGRAGCLIVDEEIGLF